MLMLNVTFGEDKFGLGGKVELEEGQAASMFALEQKPSFNFSGD